MISNQLSDWPMLVSQRGGDVMDAERDDSLAFEPLMRRLHLPARVIRRRRR
jgi:hypothetical protein